MNPTFPFLVSDLDGTLLNSDCQIPFAAKKHITKYRTNGGRFTIATGRSLAECKMYLDQLQVVDPVILYNGAAIYLPLKKEVITLSSLPPFIIEKLLKAMENLPIEADILLHSPTSIYIRRMRVSTRYQLEQFPIRYRLFPPRMPLYEPILKIQLIGSMKEMEFLKNWSTIHPFAHRVEFVQAADNYFEILPNNVSKGSALHKVLSMINLSAKQVAVIGDHCNDITMFQTASLAAAVRNAHPLAKKYATHEVPSNDADGIVTLIQHYLMRPSRSVFR
ncbi:Cof-type HAD-IIB family hydrolase [Shimazuella kribbensis]|uniref:Cof-type HAD-IIB family hydrolase n=1 Tax=Shimazuella kribbensis TaxID=139808 RepID=UPI0003F51BBE|nr:Cof-type HAD-IIB family hydrolase [Shimazuella kribbensis]